MLIYEDYALSHLWLYKVIILPHKGQGKLNKGNKHDYVTNSASIKGPLVMGPTTFTPYNHVH